MHLNQIYTCKKYARAFYHTVHSKIDAQQVINIKNLILFLTKDSTFLQCLQLDFIDHNIKKDFTDKLINKYQLINNFEKLLILLAHNRSIFLFPQILKQILEIYNINNNIIEFNIVSSNKLNDIQLLQLKTFLYKHTQKNIIYNLSIDKSLIAGIKIYSETLGWEHSIRKQLNTLRNAYKENL